MVEFFASGKPEEETLQLLFKTVEPKECVKIFQECIGVLAQATTEGTLRRKAAGSWARVILLVNRIVDDNSFPDADATLKRPIQSSLNGALLWPRVLKGGYEMGVLLCLCRKLFISGDITGSDNKASERLKPYESWLKDILKKSDPRTVEAMLGPLSELVPFEPLLLLKLNHRVFAGRRDVFKVVSEYLIDTRTRISELRVSGEIARSRNDARKDEGEDKEAKLKVMKDIMAYVSEFGEKKVVPKVLVGQMNFHRYHFRAVTMPILLAENLAEQITNEESIEFNMDLVAFDKKRIRLIKELAFKRKDHAVSTEEAKASVKKIRDLISRRTGMNGNREQGHDQHVRLKVVSDTSSIKDIIDVVLQRSIGAEFQDFKAERDTAHRFLLEKVQGDLSQISAERALAEYSLNLLQFFCQSFADSDWSANTSIQNLIQTHDIDALLEAYADWWKGCGANVLKLLPYLLGDPGVRVLQKHFQRQLFALICSNTRNLSFKRLLSLAILSACLAKLCDDESLKDVCLCSVSPQNPRLCDLFSCIMQHLTFSTRESTQNSVVFTFHSCCLLITSSTSQHLTQQTNGIGTPNGNRNEHGTHQHGTHQLVSDILRWAVRTPGRILGGKENALQRKRVVYLTWLLEMTCHLISSQRLLRSCDGVRGYLSVEARCGDGNATNLQEVFSRLQRSMSRCRIVVDAVLFICRTWTELRSCYPWINDAVIEYARNVKWCQEMTVQDKAELRRAIEESKECGKGMTEKLLQWFHQIDMCVFHNCSNNEIEKTMRALVCHLWPFDRGVVRYLIRCIGRRCVNKGLGWEYRRGWYRGVCSFAVQLDEEVDRAAWMAKSQRSQTQRGVMDNGMAAILAVRSAVDEVCNSNAYVSGDDMETVSEWDMGIERCVRKFPEAVGGAIALRLWDNSTAEEQTHRVVRAIHSKCGVWTGAVMDAAITTVCELRAPCNGGNDERDKEMLNVLVRERLQSSGCGGAGEEVITWLESNGTDVRMTAAVAAIGAIDDEDVRGLFARIGLHRAEAVFSSALRLFVTIQDSSDRKKLLTTLKKMFLAGRRQHHEEFARTADERIRSLSSSSLVAEIRCELDPFINKGSVD